MSANPNLEALETAAHALKPLLPHLVLVGGCTVGLLITDGARPPVRSTLDVDLITEVSPLKNYYKLGDELRLLGFSEDAEGPVCRWKKGAMIVDIMPADEGVLGFSNAWYKMAVSTSTTSQLPSGVSVRHVTAPIFIATKIEAFYGRGQGDFLSHDIEDIVNVVDGRAELVDEIQHAPKELRTFIADEIDNFLGQLDFVDKLSWHLQLDAARIDLVLKRLRLMAGI